MPIYEYACQQCHHHLEKLQKLSDEPLSLCPQCGEASLQRLMSAAGFQLKGTGWYETDFKHKNKPKETESSAKESKADNSQNHKDSSQTGDSGQQSSTKQSTGAD